MESLPDNPGSPSSPSNPVLDELHAHRSVRSFTGEPVTDDELRAIVGAVQAAPNWNNFQHVSVVAVREPRHRAIMARLCNDQSSVAHTPVFLVFCADFYRTWLACDVATDAFDPVTAVLDNVIVGANEVGIAVGWATVAAESLGLGTVVIGDARAHGIEMARELGLPRYVVPMLGLCVGHPAEHPQTKPRLPQEAVLFEERYDTGRLPALIEAYDRRYANYLATRSSHRKDESWTDQVAAFYRAPYNHYPELPELLARQGFYGVGEKPAES